MKYRMFILTIIFSANVYADPFKTIITHECKKINNANYAFKCNGVVSGHLNLHRTKNTNEMIPTDKEESQYVFESFIMKYIQLGGRHINITASYWPIKALRVCTAKNDRTGYRCYDCEWKNLTGGGKSCNRVE